MTGGYTGKILYLNLTNKSYSIIDTEQYEEYGGGMGIGSAIFWDLVPDKTIDGYDPGNVITMMASPISGTIVPGGAGRTEINGIGIQAYPIGWFTRSSFGNRFAGMMKYAGWDGIVIQGKADSPVWVNIVNDQVTFEDASELWGLSCIETQEDIWRDVSNNSRFGEWIDAGNNNTTTQRPAVACIGPAGENLSRIAVIMHDMAAAGQGGFGGIWGAKNLKAVSVFGTGSVSVANPQALYDARLWWNQNFQFDVDNPARLAPAPNQAMYFLLNQQPGSGAFSVGSERQRAQACQSCGLACRRRMESGFGNESTCVESMWYSTSTGNPKDTLKAIDFSQDWGLNVYQANKHSYLKALYQMGILGPGKEIDCDLPWEKYGSLGFAEELCREVSLRQKPWADDFSEGIARAAVKWGRFQEDTDSGLLALPNWGFSEHYDPRLEVEWSYGSILGDRDINEHCLNMIVRWMPNVTTMYGEEPFVTAEELANILSTKTLPYTDDPFMFDYSEGPNGIYSDHRAKTIAWHRHYTRFWKQSIGLCDWAWPLFLSANNSEMASPSPEGEPKFFNAVTGKNLTYVDGWEVGRKIWNLNKAIWVLQGRHRDMEVFAGYVYTKPTAAPYLLPVYENGEWSYSDCIGRVLNKTKFEEWKTKYYALEGWDTNSGWPTRVTLEELGLKNVADELAAAGKLGS